MKTSRSLLSALLLAFIFTLAGCSSTPNRIAHNTTSITVTTVNAAVQGWWDYKKAFPEYDRNADAQIRDAYIKYQAVMKVSWDAYEAYLTSADNAPAWQVSLNAVAAAEADLLNLILQFLPKEK